MSDEVTLYLGLDATEAFAEIQKVQQAVDEQATYWRSVRVEIESGLRSLSTSIGFIITIARTVSRITGQALDEVLMTLLQVVQATASAMLAIATAYTATGVLAPIGAALAGFTAGFSLGQSLAILQQSEDLKARMAYIEASLQGLAGGMMQGGGL